MKRILILANSVVGLCKFRKELVEALISEGNEVFFSTPNDNIELCKELKNTGAKHIETSIDRRGINPLKDLELLLNYNSILRQIRPDVVLTYTIKPNIYGGIVCRLKGVKYIANITGIGTAFVKGGLISKFVIFLNRLALKGAKKVFFQNLSNLELYLKENIVKEEDTILVNGSGVNLKKFYPMEKTENKEYPVFLFIGRIMKEKGIEEYLEAAKNIIDQGYKAEFQILGPWEETEWKEKVLKYEKLGFVKYLGTSNDVRQQIRNCDVVVNPSYHEGMSNVLLESGAMEKVLLGSDIPGIREIIINRTNDCLFLAKNSVELQQRILTLIESKERLINYAQNEHIKQNFDRDKIIMKYLNSISEVEV